MKAPNLMLRRLVAAFCLAMGLVLLLAAIFSGGDPDVFVLAGVLSTILLAAGILLLRDVMLIQGARLGAPAQPWQPAPAPMPSPVPADSQSSNGQGESGEALIETQPEVVPIIPLPGEEPVPAGPGLSPASLPQASLASGERPGAQSADKPALKPDGLTARVIKESARSLTKMVRGTNDLCATLKDMVRHDLEGRAAPASHYASQLLQRTGLMDWEDAPKLSAIMLRRTGRFWTIGADNLDDAAHDQVLSCELALNLAHAMAEQGMALHDEDIVRAAREELMDAIARPAEVIRYRTDEDYALAFPDGHPADLPREWELRRTLSHWAEHLKAHLRLTWRMAASVAQHQTCISVEVPGPDVFAVVEDESARRGDIATQHARQVALDFLVAALIVVPDGLAGEVVVNVRERRAEVTLLSMRADATSLPALLAADTEDPVISGDKIRIRRGLDGWLEPVDPFLELTDEPVSSIPRYERLPELEQFAAPPELQQAASCQMVSDLGIDENAARLSALRRVLPHAQGTTQELVSALVEERDAIHDDPTVSEAAQRAIAALVSGDVDAGDAQRLTDLFLNGSELDLATARAARRWHEDKHEPDACLAILRAVLDPLSAAGTYDDTDECAWRYFESYPERVRYNQTVGLTKPVRLVPDSYFGAHLLAANVSLAAGLTDEAEDHTRELLRLAPSNVEPYLTMSRIRQEQLRMQEADALAREALTHALGMEEFALVLYRLGFTQWSQGDYGLAAACYVCSIEMGGAMREAAESELEELVKETEVERPNVHDARKRLDAEGLRYSTPDEVRSRLLASSIVCCDMGLFRPARMLLASVLQGGADDVLVNVLVSLAPGGKV